MKSEANKVFGGYIHIEWDYPHPGLSAYRRDSDGFIFSVSNKSKLSPPNPSKAIGFNPNGSPGFGGNAIEICYCDPINKHRAGWCWTYG